MGQIVRRKRRGRPSNIDRASRSSQLAPPSPVDRRSTRRRRNVRYNFDVDDYVDDDDEDDDRGRREKKIRLLMFADDSISNRRVSHAPSSFSSEEDDDDEDYNRKRSKKRKLDRDDEYDEIEEIRRRESDEDENDEDEVEEEEEEVGGSDFDCGTISDFPKRVPMPDKKTLELILDKLQKKDIYGVYSAPVDPDELPDYHDVIKHPMDFATVRKKLAKGLYLSLKEFESDVFLICTNAMQYNAPDTVYYKQASSIQELAKMKFQKLKANTDLSEKELKPDHKTAPNFSLPKKQLNKSIDCTAPDPEAELVGAETFSGATVGTREIPDGSCGQTLVRPIIGETFIAENCSLGDNNLDQDQEPLTGKDLISKHERKQLIHDENRRATYNISLAPVTDSDSVLSTFKDESKQFIPVGLHVDHSYARSLARFAATLGPVAWKIASHLIKQALPEDVKFGPGWVGEYEPLPTPILVPENRTLNEPSFLAHFKISSDFNNNIKASHVSKFHVDVKEANDGFSPGFSFKQESPREPRKDPTRNPSPSASPRNLLFSGSNLVQQNFSRNFTRPDNCNGNLASLGSFTHPNSKNDGFAPGSDFGVRRPVSNASDISLKPVSRNRNLASLGSFRHPNGNNDGFAPGADFVAKRPGNNDGFAPGVDFVVRKTVSNASDISSKPVARKGNLASLGSFTHSNTDPNSNGDGFSPRADFVMKRPISDASDIPSKPVSKNGNLASLGSFNHPNSNNDGFVPGADFDSKSPIFNASGVSTNPLSRNGNFASMGSFTHPKSNNDGFAPVVDFVSKSPASNASDIPSNPVSRNANLASSGSFKHPNSNNDGFAPGSDFVAKRLISNASDVSSKPVSRNGNLASLGSFTHTNNNNDGFGPGAPVSNASDIPSNPVSRNGNFASLGSFKHPNSNNDGFAPGAEFVAKRPISNASDIPSKPVSRNGNLASFGSFNHPNSYNDGFAPGKPSKPVGLDCNRMVPIDGLSDPVQMMKMLSQKSQLQQNNLNGFNFGSKNESNNVALTAAHTWMSLGGAATGGVIKSPLPENQNHQKQHISADSLYNSTRDRQQPQVTRFRGEYNAYQQPVRPVNDGQLQNRNVGFPQMVTNANLSQFQVQSGWNGVPPQMQQPRPKQESRPPDLNIGYQSIGSPVRQSTGMLVDSQQPDLALQL